MLFLVDILHPAHVHFFRNIIIALENEGHKVMVTARKKEMSIDLLDAYKIPHTMISKQKNGIGLIFEMIQRSIRLMLICIKHRPKLLMGIMGPSIALVGFTLRIPVWIFYDTENAWITNCFAYPLANRIYTPNCYRNSIRKNHISYAGYHELTYLHPNLFTPDINVLEKYSIQTNKPFFLVRFVSWQASHDIGEIGIDLKNKKEIIAFLEQFGKVYITSESPLPEMLKDRSIPVSITDIHHLIAFSKIVIGESATMASEAAVLGTPAIFISDTLRGYTIEEENKYHLVYNLSRDNISNVYSIVNLLLNDESTQKDLISNHRLLLNEKVDVTQYITREIEMFMKGTK